MARQHLGRSAYRMGAGAWLGSNLPLFLLDIAERPEPQREGSDLGRLADTATSA